MASILDKYTSTTLTTPIVTGSTWNPNTPIPVSLLGNTATSTALPQKNNLTQTYNSATTGAITSAQTPAGTYTTPNGAVVDITGKIITPAPQQTQTPTQQSSVQQQPWYTDLVNMIKGVQKPQSSTEAYTQLSEQQGLTQKQQEVNDLQAQLNAITTQTQTQQLGLETQDVRRTGAVLDRMQGQIAKEQAIKALPISAALNAAQGRLQSAQDNINTLLSLQQKDQEAQYQYQKDQINYAMQFADAAQKEELQKRSEAIDAQKFNLTEFNNLKQSYVNAAIQAGDYATAGKLASAQDDTELAKLASGIKGTNLDDVYKSLQIQKLRQEISGTQGGENQQLYSGLSSATATAVRNKVSTFKSEPQVQNFATVQDGYNFADSLDVKTKNPADDQALIYSLAKALDPNSVVREGEYATAQKYAQSWVKSYGKGVEQALMGTGFLSEEARTNIKKTIEQKYTSTKKTYDNLYKQYADGIDTLTGRGDGKSFLVDYAISTAGVNAQAQTPASTSGKTSSGIGYTIIGENTPPTNTPISTTPTKTTTNYKSMLPDFSGYGGFSLGSFLK